MIIISWYGYMRIIISRVQSSEEVSQCCGYKISPDAVWLWIIYGLLWYNLSQLLLGGDYTVKEVSYWVVSVSCLLLLAFYTISDFNLGFV
jgi:hypothetical protein